METATHERPPGFFDFLEQGVDRLNHRHDHIIRPLKAEIAGSRVLDLGSHDGRWPYAMAAVGATEVVGIEGRPELVAKYDHYPESPFKNNVRFVIGDFVAAMDRMLADGETFDMVFCLGVYYHTMQHYRMMIQMAAFKPKVIVIDSVLSTSQRPTIDLLRNKTDASANAIAETEGQSWVPVGSPSLPAMEMMADSVGYSVIVTPWEIPAEQRVGVRDYFSKHKPRRRHTLVLRPNR